MRLGEAIKMCRVRRGLSQSELAKAAKCSIAYLSMLENSKRDPTISKVEGIANALNVPIEILFFLAAEKEELGNLDPDLAGRLAMTALDLLDEKPTKRA